MRMRARVLEHVRQRLLHDPVRREVDAGRQLARLALDPELDRQARLAHLFGERLEAGEARLRRERERLVVRAEHARAAAASPRAPGARSTRSRRRRRAPRAARLERAPCSARLQHDHADGVRDDVVQLARDAASLLRDRGASASPRARRRASRSSLRGADANHRSRRRTARRGRRRRRGSRPSSCCRRPGTSPTKTVATTTRRGSGERTLAARAPRPSRRPTIRRITNDIGSSLSFGITAPAICKTTTSSASVSSG